MGIMARRRQALAMVKSETKVIGAVAMPEQELEVVAPPSPETEAEPAPIAKEVAPKRYAKRNNHGAQ